MDLHHNVFYSYRGPDTVGVDRDRQLENNLTKALINTLSLGGETVWRPFLTDLGVVGATAVKFLLQRCDLPSGNAVRRRHRVLLGISKKTSAWVPDQGASADTYEGVPDAWVYGHDFAVLVESKVNDGDFSDRQMQAHLGRLRLGEDPPKIALKTWGQIHGLFCRLLPGLTGASRLLASQFIEFLEYSGMSEFTGFRPEHFHYFLLHDDEDARRWIREQVNYFAMKVLHGGLQTFAPFYEAHDVGNLKGSDSYCWVALGPGQTRYRSVTHQTMSLASDGLRVFVNTELQAAADRLKTVLRHSSGAFRASLQDLHEWRPFELILEERVQRQAALYDYVPKLRLHSSLLVEGTGNVAWEAFAQTVALLPLPYFRLERLVTAPTLMEDPVAAVQHVVEILQRNHAVVRLLNE